MLFQLPRQTQDLAALIGRLILGVVMFAFGWDKCVTKGLSATAAGFRKEGIPFPSLSAGFAGIVELVGGALLIVGAFTALVGVLMVLDMIGAIVTTHSYVSIISQRGIALPGSVLVGALLLASYGAGRYSLDHALTSRRRAKQPEHI